MKEYKIEVILNPHPWDNEESPYFWCILEWNKTAWCNYACGWSKSVKEAFSAAYDESEKSGVLA